MFGYVSPFLILRTPRQNLFLPSREKDTLRLLQVYGMIPETLNCEVSL